MAQVIGPFDWGLGGKLAAKQVDLMLYLLVIDGCDYVIFTAICVGLLGVTHFILRRRALHEGVPLLRWLVALLLLVGGWFLTSFLAKRTHEALQQTVEGLAPTYASDLEFLGHGKLASDCSPDDPLYLTLIEAEKRWLRLNPTIADIYTFRKRPDGKIFLMVDSETDYDHDGRYDGEREQRTPIGEVYEQASPPLLHAFEGVAGFDDVPYVDRWGTWVSTFVPMYTEQGTLDGVLGVDYPAESWVRDIGVTRLSTMGLVFVMQVMLMVYSVGTSILRAQKRDREQAALRLSCSESHLRATIEASKDAIIWISTHGVIQMINPAAETMFGWQAKEVVGRSSTVLIEDSLHKLGQTAEQEARYCDGYKFPVEVSLTAVTAGDDHFVMAIIRDISERKQVEGELCAHREHLEQLVRKNTQELVAAERRLMQKEKLASVGALAAGMAHEINTPIQYVGDNIRALSDTFTDILDLSAKYHELVELVKSGSPTQHAVKDIEQKEKQYDLPYIVEDTPRAIAQSLEGVARVSHIVRAMKDFSHTDQGEPTLVDINHALESTLTVARNEYKYVADVETNFGPLPSVQCFAGQMNQVFLNVIVNAAHAIADTGKRGKITVQTCESGPNVEIRIADTGTGIPAEIHSKIFDPFFTTKEVGRGSGQGLSIAHQIVVGKHHGELTFETEMGRGTTFIIRIPKQHAPIAQDPNWSMG